MATTKRKKTAAKSKSKVKVRDLAIKKSAKVVGGTKAVPCQCAPAPCD